ncbi:UNVERIFIED_CONTAM: hypothetical protein K2H54_009692 [Gekko kuhli]
MVGNLRHPGLERREVVRALQDVQGRMRPRRNAPHGAKGRWPPELGRQSQNASLRNLVDHNITVRNSQ